jgi:hypothetical protein
MRSAGDTEISHSSMNTYDSARGFAVSWMQVRYSAPYNALCGFFAATCTPICVS